MPIRPFADLLARTRELTPLFDRVIGPWSPSVMMSQLHNEVRTLTTLVKDQDMQEPLNPAERRDVEGALADVFFVLIRLAALYDIDLQAAYSSMLTTTRQCLEQQEVESPPPVLIQPLSGEEGKEA